MVVLVGVSLSFGCDFTHPWIDVFVRSPSCFNNKKNSFLLLTSSSKLYILNLSSVFARSFNLYRSINTFNPFNILFICTFFGSPFCFNCIGILYQVLLVYSPCQKLLKVLITVINQNGGDLISSYTVQGFVDSCRAISGPFNGPDLYFRVAWLVPGGATTSTSVVRVRRLISRAVMRKLCNLSTPYSERG